MTSLDQLILSNYLTMSVLRTFRRLQITNLRIVKKMDGGAFLYDPTSVE